MSDKRTSGFCCPVCGSSYFRTIGGLAGPHDRLERQCKGNLVEIFENKMIDYEGCSFEWIGKDDAKYGLSQTGEGDGSDGK